MSDDVRLELRQHANRWPLVARALAEIEWLRAGLVDVIAHSDMHPCQHAKVAAKYLRLPETQGVDHD